jgi:FkbM family methyltransferase
VNGALRGPVAPAVEHIDALRFARAATLIDVGANKGQFSLVYDALSPKGAIIAFEPMERERRIYERALGANRATLHPVALGEESGDRPFYITDRADSSSLLPPGEAQKLAFGVSAARQSRVPVRRLCDVVDVAALARPVLCKIDVQGAELAVLQGCGDLSGIDYFYVELSFVELYIGQPLLEDVAGHLCRHGFRLRGLYNQVTTARFGPTQADCLFSRA